LGRSSGRGGGREGGVKAKIAIYGISEIEHEEMFKAWVLSNSH